MNIPYCVLLILIGIGLSIFGLKRFGLSLAISFVAPTLIGLQLAGFTNQGWTIATLAIGILIFALSKPLTYFTGWFYITIFILLPVYMLTEDKDIRQLSTEIAMGVSVVITILVRKYLKAIILGIASGYSVGLGLACIIFNQLIESHEILNVLTVPFLIIFVFIIAGISFQFWLLKHPLKFNKPNLKIDNEVIPVQVQRDNIVIAKEEKVVTPPATQKQEQLFKGFQNLNQRDYIKIGIAFIMVISFFFSWFVYKASYSLSVSIPLLGSYSGGISENGMSVSGMNISQCLIVLLVSLGALILCFSRFKYLSLLGLLNLIVSMVILLWWHDNVMPNLSFSVGNDNLHAEAGIHAAFGIYLFILASIAFTVYSYEPSMLNAYNKPNSKLNSYLVPASAILVTLIVFGGIFFLQNQSTKSSSDNGVSSMIDNVVIKAKEQQSTKQPETQVSRTVDTVVSHSNDVVATNNTNTSVSTVDDLKGVWKGAFGKNQLLLVIQKMDNGTTTGYNTVKNESRPLSGTYSINNGDYQLVLAEPGDKEWDGKFTMTYNHTSKTITGSWKANNGKLTHDCILMK